MNLQSMRLAAGCGSKGPNKELNKGNGLARDRKAAAHITGTYLFEKCTFSWGFGRHDVDEGLRTRVKNAVITNASKTEVHKRLRRVGNSEGGKARQLPATQESWLLH